MGVEFRLVNARTNPILFFLIIALTIALNVRLLPEKVFVVSGAKDQQVFLKAATYENAPSHLGR